MFLFHRGQCDGACTVSPQFQGAPTSSYFFAISWFAIISSARTIAE
jgi:hypothetical protein